MLSSTSASASEVLAELIAQVHLCRDQNKTHELQVGMEKKSS